MRIQTVTAIWRVPSGSSQKIRDSWWEALATYKVSNTIQPREYSMGDGTDGTSHNGSVAKVNGNRNVPYLNRNDSKRNLNLNWWNNDWNSDYRFLAVRHFLDFLPSFNRREFCFGAVCAIRQAFYRLLQDISRDEYIFSYRAPAFPMQVVIVVSEDRRARYIDQQEQSFLRMYCSSRGNNIRLREEISHQFLIQA
ncbi:MAG: hypothetical protein NTU85_01135 [Candidatus Kaiserbacteria bacterium]|nr:hypothetical protein [Candidatus Kaiserbacteria bacterium]